MQRFLELLDKLKQEGRYVHDVPSAPARYAPAVFARRGDRGGFGKGEFYRSMQRLFRDLVSNVSVKDC